MTGKIKVYVPRETTAVSLGADEVAEKIAALKNVELVRNGSWGACWLEPLVEVMVDGTRIAYGPVQPDDIDGLVAANFLSGGEHALRLGPINEIPYLIKQERWTFFRVGLIEALSIDDYIAHGGFKGLTRAIEAGPPCWHGMRTSGRRSRRRVILPTGSRSWRCNRTVEPPHCA